MPNYMTDTTMLPPKLICMDCGATVTPEWQHLHNDFHARVEPKRTGKDGGTARATITPATRWRPAQQ